MKRKCYHLYTHSPLHCGTGQSIGSVDLPIARDTATPLPIAPGSSLRGVLRHELSNSHSNDIAEHLFGPLNIATNSDSFSGALSIGDAHLLLLPVRSFQGVVAYTTCPFILKRYRRDMDIDRNIPTPEDGRALHAKHNINKVNHRIILEDLDLDPKYCEDVDQWAQSISSIVFPLDKEAQVDLTQRFLILPDEVFSYLAQTATEIRTRIRIDQETGVVKEGALWTEEYLPPESILWGIYALTDSRKQNTPLNADELEIYIANDILLQLGGNAGIGSGLVQAYFSSKEESA